VTALLRRWSPLLAVVLVACGTPPAAVRNDLRTYIQASKSWAAVEAETAQTLDRILATQFVDEGEVLRQISDSRPRVIAHLERVRTYTPRSEAVREIHERYMAAWQTLVQGYEAIERGFSTGDYTNLARGREAMAAWRDGIVSVARDLRELMQRFGVEPSTITES
jgi:hypothetical protein